EEQSRVARRLYQLKGARESLEGSAPQEVIDSLDREIERESARLAPENKKILEEWPELKKRYAQDEYVYKVRDREIRMPLFTETLAGSRIPKVACPASKTGATS